MAERLFYEFRAPKFVDFTPMKIPDTSAYFDIFNGAGNMDIDISLPLFSETGRPTRMSSTPNKRDSCTQTPSENAQEEEGVLSDALDNMLRLEHPNNRRSVRFSDAVHVCPSPQSSKSTNEGRSSGGLEGRNSRFESKCQSSDKDSKKRQTTPIIGQTWHQALKYRSVEQHVSTPKPKKEGRSSLLAEPILRSGGVPTRVPVPAPRAEGASKTPSSIPRPVQVKVRVDPKPVLTVKPFQLTTYKPRQSPLEDPVKFFQRSKDTPVRHTQAKPAVRRLPTTDKETDISTPVPFRARPPLSLHQKPFSPRHVERPPIKTQPFRLHTEERAKKREEFENKIQEHLLQLEVQRQQIAAEKERQEALERKEMRRVKIHARPVPSFVYSPVSVSSKTLSNNQRAKGTTPTIE